MKVSLLWLSLVAIPGILSADSSKFQPKGFVQNDSGEKCWYSQTVVDDSKYFHDSLTSNIGVIKFDDLKCMGDKGLGLDINKMMINNVISGWYSHSDANFQTRVDELHNSSILQTRGQCIQSAKYPIVGIAVDYLVEDDAIIEVRHGPTVQGCTR